jgi:hypothetical protein
MKKAHKDYADKIKHRFYKQTTEKEETHEYIKEMMYQCDVIKDINQTFLERVNNNDYKDVAHILRVIYFVNLAQQNITKALIKSICQDSVKEFLEER